MAEAMQEGKSPPHFLINWVAMGSMMERIGAMGSRLTQDGIAVWGTPEIDAAQAGILWSIVDLFVDAFDQLYAKRGVDIPEWKEKYRLALGLLAKMGPDGVNLVTTNK